MISPLSAIKKFITKVLPYFGNFELVVRGVPYFCDPLLSGTIRFARRTGTQISMINPEVELYLSKDFKVLQEWIYVDRYNKWIVPGSYVRINDQENFLIASEGEEENQWMLASSPNLSQVTGAPVRLYSVPCLIPNGQTKGSDMLIVASKHLLIKGDVFAFVLTGTLFHEIETSTVLRLSDTDTEYPYTYLVTLKEPIPYDLSENATIQLRAFPSYFSEVVRIPTTVSGSEQGPFVVDAYNGFLQEVNDRKITTVIRTYDIFSNPIDSDYKEISLNYPVFQRSFNSEVMVFWNLVKGSFKVKHNRAMAVLDSDGLFVCNYKPVPFIQKGIKWKTSVQSDTAFDVKVGFEPNPFKTYSVNARELTTLQLGVSSFEEEAHTISISIIGQPGALVEFGVWSYVGMPVSKIAFGIMANVDREAEWLSSSLIVKPFFISKDYMSAKYDNSKYDSGFIAG